MQVLDLVICERSNDGDQGSHRVAIVAKSRGRIDLYSRRLRRDSIEIDGRTKEGRFVQHIEAELFGV
jgi:hypothetical protein